MPCGIALFFFLPDFPNNTKVYFLSEEEKALALSRCANNGIVFQTGVVNFKTLKRILGRWRFWVLVPTYLFYATGIQAYNYFTIYLKSAGFPVTIVNVLPSTTYVLQMPVEYILGYISDRTGNRFLACLCPLLFLIFPTTVLAVWPKSVGLKIAAFVCNGMAFVTHIFYTWLNEICKGDMEERGFLIAATNTLFYA
jgi:ACS family pantothenate transporter-like MFS transporter